MPSQARSELRLHISGMDCADEAALVRHVLDRAGHPRLELRPGRAPRRRLLRSRPPAARGHHRAGRRHRPRRARATVGASTCTTTTPRTATPTRTTIAPGSGSRSSGALHAGGLGRRGAGPPSTWTERLLGHDRDGRTPTPRRPGGLRPRRSLSGSGPMMPRALASLRHLRLDMHVLVCISAVGAAAVGQWAEGAAVAVPVRAGPPDRGVEHRARARGGARPRWAEPGWDEDGEGRHGRGGGAVDRTVRRRLHAGGHGAAR